MKEHEPDFEVQIMAQALNVSPSGYYAWKKRPASPRQQRRVAVVEQIRQAHERSRGTYGSPRITVELQAAGVEVCRNTVDKYMHQEGIEGCTPRRFRVQTTDSRHDHPIAPNRLQQQFEAAAPDTKWCCDITYVPTDQGWLYLAAVIDLCSRKIVGWAMAEHLRSELCLEALSMALQRRQPQAGLLHHSDRGVQYACGAYHEVLQSHGICPSMSRNGNCYDNAVMESFFGTLKTELIYRQHYATRAEARLSIFEYIEVFYNRQRRHSAIGYVSPETFEASLN